MSHVMQESFSGYGFVVVSQNETPTSAETTFSEDWHEKYFREEFHKIDPVFEFNHGCNFRGDAKILTNAEMENPLYEEAVLANANSNFMSVSIIGGSRLIFGGVNADLDTRKVPDLHRMVQIEHRKILMQRIDELTDGQIDFLEMYEEGLLDKQVAVELNASTSAVAQRKTAICNKIGVAHWRSVERLYSLRKWGGIVPLA